MEKCIPRRPSRGAESAVGEVSIITMDMGEDIPLASLAQTTCTRMDAPYVLGQSNSRKLAMGTVGHDGSMLRHVGPWLPDARRHLASI